MSMQPVTDITTFGSIINLVFYVLWISLQIPNSSADVIQHQYVHGGGGGGGSIKCVVNRQTKNNKNKTDTLWNGAETELHTSSIRF